MWWLRIICLVFLLHCHVAKETAVYQVSGVELVDLIRGFTPKDGKLKLNKVEGERASLPDGIYFSPEDDALSAPGEHQNLYINGQGKKSDVDNQDGVTTSN